MKKLSTLFAPIGGGTRGLIPKVSRAKLAKALNIAAERNPYGRQCWDQRLRLKDLTLRERRILLGALVSVAPKWWRAGS